MDFQELQLVFQLATDKPEAERRLRTWIERHSTSFSREEIIVLIPCVILGKLAVSVGQGGILVGEDVPGIETMSPKDVFQYCQMLLQNANRVLILAPAICAWHFDILSEYPDETIPLGSGYNHAGVSGTVMPGVISPAYALQAILASCVLDECVVIRSSPHGALSVVSNDGYLKMYKLRERLQNYSPKHITCMNFKNDGLLIRQGRDRLVVFAGMVINFILLIALVMTIFYSASRRSFFSFVVAMELSIATWALIFVIVKSQQENFYFFHVLGKFMGLDVFESFILKDLYLLPNPIRDELSISLLAGGSTNLPVSTLDFFGGPVLLPRATWNIDETIVGVLLHHKTESRLVSPLTGFQFSVHKNSIDGIGSALCLKSLHFFEDGLTGIGMYDTELNRFCVCRAGELEQVPIQKSNRLSEIRNILSLQQYSFPQHANMQMLLQALKDKYNFTTYFTNPSEMVCSNCQSNEWVSGASSCLPLLRNEIVKHRMRQQCHVGSHGCILSEAVHKFLTGQTNFSIASHNFYSDSEGNLSVSSRELLEELSGQLRQDLYTGGMLVQLTIKGSATVSRAVAALRCLLEGKAVAYLNLETNRTEVIAQIGELADWPVCTKVQSVRIASNAKATAFEDQRFGSIALIGFFASAVFAIATGVLSIVSAAQAGEAWYERVSVIFFWPALGTQLAAGLLMFCRFAGIFPSRLPTWEGSPDRAESVLMRMGEKERILHSYIGNISAQHSSGSATYVRRAVIRSGALRVPPISKESANYGGIVTTARGTAISLFNLDEARFSEDGKRLKWMPVSRRGRLTTLEDKEFGPLV